MVRVHERNFRQGTVIAIGKFAILWNVFENTKCDYNCTPQKLVGLGNYIEVTETWRSFAIVLQQRMQMFGVSMAEYIDRHLQIERGHRLTQEDRQLIFDFIQSNGTRCMSGGLLTIYRIRNNMFHGLKEWLDLDNQINLFVSMNEVLEEIL